MPKYAMMNGNRVENIIVADDKDKEVAEKALNTTLVEFDDDNPAGYNYTLNEDGTFSPPAETPTE